MASPLPMIPVDSLRPSPANARTDLGDLEELAASIRAVGLLQPLVVHQVRGGWQVVDGHRRLAAAKLAHARALPCIAVRPGDEQRDTTLMLAAAMHKQLEPIEQGRAFQRLREAGMSVVEIARTTGYTPRTVANRLLVATLPVEVQDMVDEGEMTVTQATDLARQVRRQSSGSTTATSAGTSRTGWFNTVHPLAGDARRRCDPTDHRATRQVLGGVACGPCWEDAIRDHEQTSTARA